MTKTSCWASPLAVWVCIALCVLPWRVSAANSYYVTPSGAGDYGGTNWHNAYSNVQAAATLATNAGDAIYLQSGVYSNASQVVISNAAGVWIYGGCYGGGGGNSNVYSGTNSMLTRTGGVMRIVYGHVSTVTVAGVTVSGGYFTNGANHGAGLYFTNCGVTLTNCMVRDNTNASATIVFGGGVYAAGGSLTILDSAFNNNTLRGTVSSVYGYGGGIAAVNCSLTVRGSGSVFSNNTMPSSGYSSFYGGAVYVTNGALTLEGATLIGNYAEGGANGTSYGGAVCHVGSGITATITGCGFVSNSVRNGEDMGGAVYLRGATGVVANCTFTSNCSVSANAYGQQGMGVYANGLQSLQVVSNVFQGNRSEGTGGKNGGALYLAACSNTVVDSCTIDGSGISAGTAPEQVYVSGGGRTWFLNSTLQNNNAGKGINFAGGAGSVLGMTNCLIVDNQGNGLTFSVGNAALLNCLLARNSGDGMGLAAGTVTVANCTLAYNGGWGLNRSGGTGTVFNSIAWGNACGGISSNANMLVDYSCSQTPAYGGTNNISGDPLFANVPGCYYLSVSGLTGQTMSSPCIDAGSNTPASWGLDTRTTRTDGTNDTNTVVDLGYHYTNGVSDSSILTLTNCYVDAVNGSDASNGLSWASAWQSLTKALSNVAANATINAAAGTYNRATGETFPLTVQMPGLTLAASNANPALTVLDNAGTNGQRVLQALCKGTVVLKGLTFRGGRFTSGENYGAGLLFQGCVATLTNCVVRDNTNASTAIVFGGGVYAAGGSLTILDSAFNNNTRSYASSGYGYGGGIAAVNCSLTVRGSGCVFSNNTMPSSGYSSFYGGAVYVTNGALTLEGATLIGNNAESGNNGVSYGGAVYHEGSGMAATITGCGFVSNSVRNGEDIGGAVYLRGATGVVANCTFTSNCSVSANAYVQQGMGVYANGLQSLQVVSNVFQGNRSEGTGGKNGGALYLTACSNTVVDSCTIDGSGISAGTAPEQVCVNGGGRTWFLGSTLQNNNAGKGINFAGGAGSVLGMINCLIVKNRGDGLRIAGGTATVVNCTLANNTGLGIARPTSAGLTVTNSIFWGNMFGGIEHNQNLVLTYTDSQDAWAAGMGVGNMSQDPLFVDPAAGDFHEMSLAGSWHGGLWALDGHMSPCIDAGEPAPGSPYALEHKPTGGRINMGAYGNTAQSSLSSRGTVVRVW